MGNRAAFIDVLLASFDEICPGHGNDLFYRSYLASISDKEFEQIVLKIESGEEFLPLVIPNLSGPKMSVERNLEIARKWDVSFFQKIWMTDPADPDVVYLTPHEYFIGKIPVRRQAQTLDAGLSSPLDNSQIDQFTGQVTGISKSSAMTVPEAQILGNEQLYKTLEEFMDPRGGNNAGAQLLERAIIETGKGGLVDSDKAKGRAKSVSTGNILLTAAHLGNTL